MIGGYKASAAEFNHIPGKAIGFVMTTYRKLASSSIAAIELALRRRLDKLMQNVELADVAEIDVEELKETMI